MYKFSQRPRPTEGTIAWTHLTEVDQGRWRAPSRSFVVVDDGDWVEEVEVEDDDKDDVKDDDKDDENDHDNDNGSGGEQCYGAGQRGCDGLLKSQVKICLLHHHQNLFDHPRFSSA